MFWSFLIFYQCIQGRYSLTRIKIRSRSDQIWEKSFKWAMGSYSYSETMDHLNWKDEIFDLFLYEFHTILKHLFSCEILSASVITD